MVSKDDFLAALNPSTCGICLEEYDGAHIPVEMPKCGHHFGDHCIANLVESAHPSNNKCPLCRQVLFEQEDYNGYGYPLHEVVEEEEEEEEEGEEVAEDLAFGTRRNHRKRRQRIGLASTCPVMTMTSTSTTKRTMIQRRLSCVRKRIVFDTLKGVIIEILESAEALEFSAGVKPGRRESQELRSSYILGGNE